MVKISSGATVFYKKFSFNPFAKHPVVQDLIVRVDKARRTA